LSLSIKFVLHDLKCCLESRLFRFQVIVFILQLLTHGLNVLLYFIRSVVRLHETN